jgi:hypothetical protein
MKLLKRIERWRQIRRNTKMFWKHIENGANKTCDDPINAVFAAIACAELNRRLGDSRLMDRVDKFCESEEFKDLKEAGLPH